MDKLASIGIAVAFALVAFVGPASAIGILDSSETLATPSDEDYITAGGALNVACGIEGIEVNIGGVCVAVEAGEEFSFDVIDDTGLEMGGQWRFNAGGNVGDPTFYCGGDDIVVEDDAVLQIFVGDGLSEDCPSVATTGTVAFS